MRKKLTSFMLAGSLTSNTCTPPRGNWPPFGTYGPPVKPRGSRATKMRLRTGSTSMSSFSQLGSDTKSRMRGSSGFETS